MRVVPFKTQLDGAAFLAPKQHALLADAPRCGKTGAAIMACDYELSASVLVITTASGRPVWRRAWGTWSDARRSVSTITGPGEPKTDVAIVGWGHLKNPYVIMSLRKRKWDRLISDEDHNASNPDSFRTQSLYGTFFDDGENLNSTRALCGAADGVWQLTGTPLPNSPLDTYVRLRALWPERLAADPARGWPDVMTKGRFMNRYCVVAWKRLANNERIPVVIKGQNEEELQQRLVGTYLRRTQEDVGIRPPIFELLPLECSRTVRDEIAKMVDFETVMQAVETNDTGALDMHLGPLRRFTGGIKAKMVVEAVKDEFDGGLDKIVLAYWHRDVGNELESALSKYGLVRIDGSTPANMRGVYEQRFLNDPKCRISLSQIRAAGEAIDQSSAAVLWFVETSSVPKDMAQMSMRITNFTQKRQAFVRVCVLENSIDEALQAALLRKWTSIRKVI